MRRISETTGCPALSTTGASVHALRTLGVDRIAVATPYDDTINQRLANFFTSEGFDLVSLVGLGLRDRYAQPPLTRRPVSAIAQQSEELVYRLARSAVRPGAQALFISCTNLPTLGIITRLEQDLGLPVVTANQATIWAACRQAGLGELSPTLGTISSLKP